ncbi:hypothetical protein [Halegenticoccus tardaugens]|uniref:hypothetical protein n=1 Tax=Halegenticoccus tardaugens TaxID=2071624 RepID=UPI0013E99878|nr:hypothetical protein [Halegenticoccus tardaugens]
MVCKEARGASAPGLGSHLDDRVRELTDPSIAIWTSSPGRSVKSSSGTCEVPVSETPSSGTASWAQPVLDQFVARLGHLSDRRPAVVDDLAVARIDIDIDIDRSWGSPNPSSRGLTAVRSYAVSPSTVPLRQPILRVSPKH